MHAVVEIALLLLLVLAVAYGALMGWVWYRLNGSADSQKKELSAILAACQLTISHDAWSRLDRRARRRARWGAIGAGSGSGSAMGVVGAIELQGPLGGDDALLAAAGLFIGVQVGKRTVGSARTWRSLQ